MISGPELFILPLIGIITFFISIGIAIYLISLIVRLVRAVEKIAGNLDAK